MTLFELLQPDRLPQKSENYLASSNLNETKEFSSRQIGTDRSSPTSSHIKKNDYFSLQCSPSKIQSNPQPQIRPAGFVDLSGNSSATGYTRLQRGNIIPHVFKATAEHIPGSSDLFPTLIYNLS